VSLFCIMRTSTRKAPATFPVKASVGVLICALIMVISFGKSLVPIGIGFPVIETAAVFAFIPVALTKLYVSFNDRK